jgi:hypothetical protein
LTRFLSVSPGTKSDRFMSGLWPGYDLLDSRRELALNADYGSDQTATPLPSLCVPLLLNAIEVHHLIGHFGDFIPQVGRFSRTHEPVKSRGRCNASLCAEPQGVGLDRLTAQQVYDRNSSGRMDNDHAVADC